jgi:cytochrome c oxidase assembly factor CtaG
MLMQAQATLSDLSPIFALTFRVTGYLAIFGIVLAIGYILSYSRRRIQRVSAALVIWFFASLALYVFWGPLF